MATTTLPLATYENLPVTNGSFQYIKYSPNFDHEKPYHFNGDLDPDQEHLRTNITYERRHDIPLHDLRGLPKSATLETHGFQFMNHQSQFTAGFDDDEVVQSYVLETLDLLKEFLGCDTVLCYDSRFRQSKSIELFPEVNGDGSRVNPEAPAWLAHVDHTRDGGLRRVRRHLTESEERKYLDGNWRVRIINVWRPLHRPVKDAPLAFCDPETLTDTDLLAVDTPGPDRVGEVYHVKFNENQRWYWLSDQKPDEVSIFTSWDSDAGTAPAFTVHAAAGGAEEGLPDSFTRESVEVRAIVFTKK